MDEKQRKEAIVDQGNADQKKDYLKPSSAATEARDEDEISNESRSRPINLNKHAIELAEDDFEEDENLEQVR